ncbi:MAG: hypothetical protein ACETWT_14395 [Thermodesulfobacteriota bacterium]
MDAVYQIGEQNHKVELKNLAGGQGEDAVWFISQSIDFAKSYFGTP